MTADAARQRGAARSDEEDVALLVAARAGSVAAFGVLYERYRPDAVARARRLLGSGHRADVEDVVEITFAAVFDAIRHGSGPKDHFARYLMVALRHTSWRLAGRRTRGPLVDPVALERRRARSEVELADRPAPETHDGDPDGRVPGRIGDEVLDPSLLLAAAYRSLSDRHRTVLWLTAVEGYDSSEVAPMLGLSANASAALAYRARQALRTSYFATYADQAEEGCEAAARQLAAFAAQALDVGPSTRVEDHLAGCGRCRDVLRGVSQVGTTLATIAPFGAVSTGWWLAPGRPRVRRAVPAARAAAGRWGPVLVGTCLVLGGLVGVRTLLPRALDAAFDERTAVRHPGPVAAPDAGPVEPTDRVELGPVARTEATVEGEAPAVTPLDGGTEAVVRTAPRPSGAAPSIGRLPSSPSPPVGTEPEPPSPEGAESTGVVHGTLRWDPDGGGPRRAVTGPGVPVRLVPPTGAPVAVTTDVSGRVAPRLAPGRYEVQVEPPVGLVVDGLPRGPSAVERAPAGFVSMGTLVVRAGEVTDLDLDLVARRRLAVADGAADRPRAPTGSTVTWSFDLTSLDGATDRVAAVVELRSPRRGSLDVDAVDLHVGGRGAVDGRASRRDGTPPCRATESARGTWRISCWVGRLDARSTRLELRVTNGGGSSGSIRPQLMVGTERGFAEAASSTGSVVELVTS